MPSRLECTRVDHVESGDIQTKFSQAYIRYQQQHPLLPVCTHSGISAHLPRTRRWEMYLLSAVEHATIYSRIFVSETSEGHAIRRSDFMQSNHFRCYKRQTLTRTHIKSSPSSLMRCDFRWLALFTWFHPLINIYASLHVQMSCPDFSCISKTVTISLKSSFNCIFFLALL